MEDKKHGFPPATCNLLQDEHDKEHQNCTPSCNEEEDEKHVA